MIVVGSLIILLIPLFIAGITAFYCWRQEQSARLALLICTALISLHTHAYYFPAKPLQDRYANMLLKTSPAN